jgi:translocation and assembly module TamB
MARWLHLCWSLPLLLAVLALGALDYLAYTPGGLQVVARALNRRIGPVNIQIKGASGVLAYGLHVDLLVIDHRRVHIEIEDASGQMAILPLAWRTIDVPAVHAQRLLIHVLPRIDNGSVWEPHFLPPLTRIEARSVRVDQWRLMTPNGSTFDTTRAEAVGTLLPKVIHIYSGGFDYGEVPVHVRTNGDVLAAQSIGLNGALHFHAQPENQPAYTVNARIEGNMARLGLDANFTEPFGATFRGRIDDVTSNWHWQGRARVGRFDLSAWNAGRALGIMTADLQLEGDHTGFRAKGTVDPPALGSGPLDSDFAGRYDERVLTISRVRLHHPASGTTLEASGSVTVVPGMGGGLRPDLHGSWSHLRWPLGSSDAPFHSEHGTYTLQELRPYAFTTQGDLRVSGYEPFQINMRGRLAADGLTAESAQVEALGAVSQLSGRVHWLPSSGWQVQGRVIDLDVARLRPQTAGRLEFSYAAGGDGFGAGAALEASVSDIGGSVRGQRAQGHAHIARRGGEWQFNDVRLQLGATRIDLDGRASSSAVDLNFAVDASDLALIQSDARGQLLARGHIRGDLQDPTIITSAQARNLQWRGIQLRSLDGNIEFDPHGSGRADSTVRLQDLQVSNRKLEHLSIRSEGTTANHSLAVDAQAEGYTLSAHGNGHYASGGWQGEITGAEFGDTARLHMALESPAPLLVDGTRLRLEPLCLRDSQTRLCMNANLDPAQRSASIVATNMPMRALTAGLTAATEFDGSLSVGINANATGSEPWRGSVKAQLDKAAIHKHFKNGRVETLDLGNGNVTVLIREHDLSGELSLDAQSSGHISSTFRANGSDDDWRTWPLSGELSLETDALGYVSAFVGQLDRASGRLSAQLKLTGTPASPHLDGELALIHTMLDAYQINLSLREVNLTARLKDDSLSLDGSALAGPDGHAAVKGNLRWQHGLPYGDLHLTGEDLRVFSIPEARVDASPDVYVHLDGRRIELHGQVTLPYARIEPANLTNAVLASSDEVIVGEQKPVPEDEFKVFSNLTLTLGERVTVNTHGLSGRLSGSINVASDDSAISRGSGELKVEEGKYLAYGRNLDIQHGRLLFSNGLLSDPGLDLRAVKKFPDITAGINVRGTLRSPRMTFFSDPEVSQTQIVSLLFAGGSLESIQNSTDTAARSNAGRSDALMQGGALLAQQIGGRYDIEAGVEQDMTNETSLVLGRYLSPRLYVSYGVGLAEAINTIKMRYTIGDHWTVKTEAGTQSSADLVFTIER